MAKKPAGKSKARGKAKSKAAPRGPQTLKQRAGQKIREDFSDLGDSQAYVQLFGATGLTLEEQLMADLKMRDDGDSSITFGKLYYAEKKIIMLLGTASSSPSLQGRQTLQKWTLSCTRLFPFVLLHFVLLLVLLLFLLLEGYGSIEVGQATRPWAHARLFTGCSQGLSEGLQRSFDVLVTVATV